MEIQKKIALAIFILNFCFIGKSQEMDIGLGMGVVGDVIFQDKAFNINAICEFRPNHSLFSFQTHPGIIVVDNEYIIGAFPLSINLIIGNKFRVCPNVGGFYWTIRRGGWSAGLNLQYSINEKISMFMNSQYLQVYYQEYTYIHSGDVATAGLSWRPGLNLSIGVKYRIKKGST